MSVKRVVRKICLLGSEGVGKTSLVERYLEDSFSEVYKSTIGVSLSKKTIINDQSEIVLMVWDLEGSHDPKEIPPEYLEGALGAIAVADLARPETYIRAVQFSKSFLHIQKSGFSVLAVNKADLYTENRALENFKSLLEDRSGVFTQVELVSAKSGQGVAALFDPFVKSDDV